MKSTLPQARGRAGHRSSHYGARIQPLVARRSATIGVVTHEVPAGISSGSGQGGSSPLTSIQKQPGSLSPALTTVASPCSAAVSSQTSSRTSSATRSS
ncbi:hypothetical protein C8039_17600 [Halogeometricum sp. wsp3]|nr:hypothetical protein C8039_17600 [Halogeometricum sp. wsp3]